MHRAEVDHPPLVYAIEAALNTIVFIVFLVCLLGGAVTA